MYHILYVDDEPALLEIGKLFLELSGDLSVDIVTSAQEAIELLKDHVYDAVVSDYEMRGIDGLSFLKYIRPKYSWLPFILFTGRGREEVVIEALNNGADFYLQKGGDPKSQFIELAHKIRRAVRCQRGNDALRKNEERLRMAQTIGQIGSWEYNLVTNKFWASGEAFQLFGVPQPDDGVISIEDVEACIPEHERVHNALVSLIEDGGSYDLEYIITPADGSAQRFVHSIAQLIHNAEGPLVRVLGVVQDVTRQRSEERIARERENFQKILSGAPVGILLVNQEMIITQANKYFSDIVSREPAEIIGMRPGGGIGCLHSTEEPEGCGFSRSCPDCPLRIGIQTVLKEGKSLNNVVIELPLLIHGELQKRWLSVSAEPIELDGSPHTIVSIDDITRLKQSEQALQESENRFRAIFAKQQNGILIIDPQDHRVVDVNPYMTDLVGLPKDQIIGKVCHTFVCPAEKGRCPVTDLGQCVDNAERVLLAADGREVPVIKTVSRITLGGKDYLIENIQDITERKQAEQALELTQFRLESAMEAGSIAWWEMDRATGNVIFNERKARMLGYPPEQFSHFTDFTQLVHPDDYESMMQGMRDHLSGIREQYDVDYRMRTQNGEYRWFHDIGGISEYALDGRPSKIVGLVIDITERKRAEQALLESEQQFREIFEKANDAFHLCEIGEDGSPGKFIDVNDVTCRMMQYSRDEMLQHTPLDFATEYHSRPVEEILEELGTLGHTLFETGHRRKDGTIVPVEVNAHVIELMGKSVIFSVVRNITDRQKAEEALIESEKKYRTILEDMQDLFYRTDRSGMITMVNPLGAQQAGYDSPKELIGIKNVQDIYADSAEREQFLSAMEASGKVTNYPLTLKTRDGTLRYTMANCHYYYDTDGTVLGVEGILHDITERKLAEQALLESEERFRSFVENASDIVYSLSPEGIFTYVSPKGVEILGNKATEVVGQSFEAFVHPDDTPRCRALMQQLITTRKMQPGVEYRLRHRDETWRWHTTNISIIQDNQGTIVSFLGIDREIITE